MAISELGSGEYREPHPRKPSRGSGNGGPPRSDIRADPQFPGERSLAPDSPSNWLSGSEVKDPYAGKSPELVEVSLMSPAHVTPREQNFAPGTVTSACFTKMYAVVLGNESQLDVNTEYSVHKVRLDVDSFVDGLRPKTLAALDAFSRNIDSAYACRKFQESLPDDETPPAEHPTQRYDASTPVRATIARCSIEVIGQYNTAVVNKDFTAPVGELDLGAVFGHSTDAATALARFRSAPDDPTAQQVLDEAITQAVTPDMLRGVLDNATFGTKRPAVSRFLGSMRANDFLAGQLGKNTTCRSRITVRAHRITTANTEAWARIGVPTTDPAGPLHARFGPQSTVPPAAKPAAGSRPDGASALDALGFMAVRRRRWLAQATGDDERGTTEEQDTTFYGEERGHR